MSTKRLWDLVFAGLIAAAAVVFLPRALAPGSAFVARMPEAAILTLTPLVKLACLLVAAWAATASARGFEAGNPVRPAWRLLATGLGLYALGQAVSVYYQLLRDVRTPFPSPADFFFVLSAGFLILALPAFVRAFRDAGFPFDPRRDVLLPGAAGVLLGIGVLFLVHPALDADRFGLAEALNVFYPLSDVVMLVPAIVLARITARLRGGSVAAVWALLAAGFLVLVVGDVCFAWLTIAEDARFDPLGDLAYVVAYALFARATLRQRELLAG